MRQSLLRTVLATPLAFLPAALLAFSVEVPVAEDGPAAKEISAPDKNGRVWSATIRIEGAERMAVRLGDFFQAPGGVLIVSSEDGSESFLIEGRLGAEALTPFVSGAAITLELLAPTAAEASPFVVLGAVAEFADSGSAAARQAVESKYFPPIEHEPEPGRNLVYGNDDRVEALLDTNPIMRSAVEAVCILTGRGELTNNGNGTYTLESEKYDKISGIEICSNERFKNQTRAGFCTGFLISDNIIVTAGHCLDEVNVSDTVFVFSYIVGSGAEDASTVARWNNVYFGSRLLARILDPGVKNRDFAIVELDRAVTGRKPLEVSRLAPIVGTPVGVIGHPVGLPMKSARNATIRASRKFDFTANLDAFGGNSGSPVLNLNTGKVEGILVRGYTDFQRRPLDGCVESVRLEDSSRLLSETYNAVLLWEFLPFSLAQRDIAVTEPVGKSVRQGSVIPIRWRADLELGSTVRLQLRNSAGPVRTIISATNNDGEFEWLVPDDVIATDGYRIRVTTLGTREQSGESFAPFSIAKPAPGPVVLSPSGGEQLRRGTSTTIRWSGAPGKSVKLQLLKGDTIVRTIAASTPNDGNQRWSLPSGLAAGGDYRVRLVAGDVVVDSYSVFSVTTSR